MTIIVVLALCVESSGAQEVAGADRMHRISEVHEKNQAREFAVEMLGTKFSSSRAAAEAALRGSESEFDAYVKGGMVEARIQDLRQIVVTMAALSGPAVQAAAKKATDAGDEQSLATFIDSGWEQAQRIDDRNVAWRASQAPVGTSLKQAADKALQANTSEALSDFAAMGQDIAKTHDRRREVYALTRSASPAVARGAQEAIQTGTDTAIESYLRYGQFVAAAQDAEKLSIEELVDTSVAESDKARDAANLAAQNADQARRATEAARVATEQSKAEAQAANAAEVRAGNAAAQAGKLANQSALAADNAVSAAADARRALQQTADALARAASAASRARIAAQEASSRAAAAGMNASQAHQARVAAENARNAAAAAERAAQSFAHADAAQGFAQSAGSAAAAAAGNADAAAAAASAAAAAAGQGDAAAAEARAGAARARAAAGRARAAANEVGGLVGRIRTLVDQARQALRDAAEHARRSAQAAESAAAEADKAITSAHKAGMNAQDAQLAANKAIEAVNLASEISKLARDAADQRLAQEAAYLKDQAIHAREVQDIRDAMDRAHQEQRTKLEEDLQKLSELVAGNGDHGVDLGEVKQLAVSAVQVATPAIAGSAAVALTSGREEDLQAFVDAYDDFTVADVRSRVEFLALNDPDPEIQEAADMASYDSGENIQAFLNEELPELRKPRLITRTWQLRAQGGDAVKRAADVALRENTFDALDEFVQGGGYERALHEDQLRQAYKLVETGTPEVKAAAQAAVVGDREGLAEFIGIEAARRASADAQRVTHDAYISGLLDRGYQAAQSAAQHAAEAQQSYFVARGDAETAVRYANEAVEWAGKAQQSAVIAQQHAHKAGESLHFALQQQQRAQAAADQAERDASAAISNANQAASYAAQAHESASHAAVLAAQARRSADAAGHDADVASQAAQEAYAFAWDKQLAEQEQYRAAAAEGELHAEKTSLLEFIKQQVGQETLDLLLDLIGVKDVLDCFSGEVSACLWAALGALPVGKIVKLRKVVPAIKKLTGKSGQTGKLTGNIKNIQEAILNSRFGSKLDNLLSSVNCVGGRPATWSEPATFQHAVWRPSAQAPYENWRAVVDVCALQLVNGRKPINWRFAGGIWRNGDPARMPKGWEYGDIHFSKRGFPIFDPYVEELPETIKYDPKTMPVPGRSVVKISPARTREGDFSRADRILGIDAAYRAEHKLVWHHHEDTGIMQLIPQDLHSAVKHTGGWAIWGGKKM